MNHEPHPIPAEEVMAYVDAELTAERAAEISAHLEACSECRELAAGFRQVSEHMASWTVEPAPGLVTFKVMGALRPARSLPAWILKGAVAALALAVVVAMSIPNLLRSRIAAPQNWGGAVGMSREAAPSFGVLPLAPKPAPGPMIIRTASLTIVPKDFDGARVAVERIAREHGGYLAQLRASGQEGAARSLSATLRIPSDRLDAALAELKTIGRVEQESQGGEEVTQQHMDLTARLANARNTEKRLQDVLRQRTAKMADILAVERELARVREEIERMDAQLRNLDKQVALATVELTVREQYKAEVDVPMSVSRRLWNAGVEGYQGLVETGLGLMEFLLRSGPTLALWILILFLPARLAWRRLRSRAC